MKRQTLGVFSILLFLFISGCTKVGPEYSKPKEIVLPKGWNKTLSKSDHNITSWWKQFNDKTLNILVEKTYTQNLDLRSAGLRILQARASLGLSEGLVYPQQQSISASIASVRSNGNTLAASSISFDMGWEMDIWGKYARGIEVSEAGLYASIASYDEILVRIIAEVARNYVNYQTAQERIKYAQRNISIQEKIVEITKVQFNSGNVSGLDMYQARTQLYTTKSVLPSLELSKIKSINAIAILLGVLPQEVEDILETKSTTKQEPAKNIFEASKVRLLKHNYNTTSYIPMIALDKSIDVDADLIRRRPDIRVAELQTKAQNARIGAAQADLYPHFSLFGSIGYNNQSASGVHLSPSDAISITAGPSFSWNIFQYGRIKNQVRLQDALFQESLVNYNKTVLLAVQEVSNALNSYTLTKEQLVLNAQAIEATVNAFNISITQYNDGLVGYQRLLTSVKDLTRSEDQYAQIQGNVANHIISLYKALGGGWEMASAKPYLHDEDIKQMQKRSDWGEYFDTNSSLEGEREK